MLFGSQLPGVFHFCGGKTAPENYFAARLSTRVE